MKIRTLSLCPFRNLDRTSIRFKSDRILLTGPNGGGKTNILEAIAYLSIGRSVRGASDRECIPHCGEYYDISALCQLGTAERSFRLFYGRHYGKQASVCGEVLPRISSLIGCFRTVHMASDSGSQILRSPAQRRRLLDIVIAQYSSEYIVYLQRYQRVLAQRNAILKSGRDLNSSSLQTWTEQLIQLGGWIRENRINSLSILRDDLIKYASLLGRSVDAVDVRYSGASQTEQSESVYFDHQLNSAGSREVDVGYTLVGPHRDDLVFTINGVIAPTFASEGQLKSILIAWKMAEVVFLQEPCTGQPVLLLDDVLLDLDEYRSSALMEIVNEFEQVIITSPRRLSGELPDRFQLIDLK